MSGVAQNISIALGILIYVAVLVLLKPASDGGRLALKLSLVNALGWIVMLALPPEGHPPLWLIVGVLFWPLNLVLIPASSVALWKSYQERDEKTGYLVAAGLYFLLNFAVLIVMPLAWLLF